MATIDIRDEMDAEIDVIKFSDKENHEDLCLLKKTSFVSIEVAESGGWTYCIDTETDAENLIKALQKAIELGWWK
jgi:hypothetical protein